ncbi:MAG: hypothetical protein UX87_C0049G0013 [Candidatus Amesbacteria bacterium GW2011_GWA1_47_16]|uniref:Uncharacterized protein n=1 Tax=Candidatus Amesbacteria bacterium GW2011_GWA1_47_16 TaxID=1618353 RepID=A0A0G1RZ86_9BACT|nr:MAG: hypothetical protein UX87_C0049G0013 [Candidatus Amesbacteria bacterium GW2011_GWA1_47_16]
MDTKAENQEVSEKRARISPKNFVYYLAGVSETGEGRLVGRKEDFDKEFDAGETISQTIKEMYSSKRTGEGMGEDTDNRIARLKTALEEIMPGVGKIFETSKQGEVELEQARVIIINTDTQMLGATEPVYGMGAEVNLMETLDKVPTGNSLPLIIVHTHPQDQLFSFDDYFPMLIGEPETGRRFFRGIMVLTPEMQVMAVATSDTPIFWNAKEAEQFILAHNTEFEEMKIANVKEKLKQLDEIGLKKNFLQTLEAVKAMEFDTDDATKQQLNAMVKKIQNKEVETLPELESQSQLISREGANMQGWLTNSSLVRFANMMQVKLYSSTDTRNFREFSA